MYINGGHPTFFNQMYVIASLFPEQNGRRRMALSFTMRIKGRFGTGDAEIPNPESQTLPESEKQKCPVGV